MISAALLNNLSDVELLSQIDSIRSHSPIISELCDRLEAKGLDIADNVNHQIECPICMASLIVDYDEGNNLFTVCPDNH